MKLMMARAEMFGHHIGVFELVPALFRLIFESHRESKQILHALLGQQRHQQTRIEPAREQHANFHIGDEQAFFDGRF